MGIGHRDVKSLGDREQAVGRQIVILARQHQRIDQVGDLDLAIQAAELTVQELDVELGVVADDHRSLKPLHHFVGDLCK